MLKVQYDKNLAILRKIIYVITIALLCFVLYQQYNFKQLQQEYATYSEDATARISNLTKQITTLETQRQELTGTVDSITDENKDLQQSYDALQKQAETTIEQIKSYETDIKTSMEWFNTNANLDTLSIKNDIVELSVQNCYDLEFQTCVIKTGCFYLSNSAKLSINYISDEITSGELDKLQSLVDFYANKGGDCEDYSLFYKAEFNHVLDLCEDEGATDIRLEAWIPTVDEHRYWLDFSKSWFLQYAEAISFSDGHKYPNVVCGNIYDLNEQKVSGHCVLAFTKKQIHSEDDLVFLDDAVLVEPQDGTYMGRVNGDGGILLKNHIIASSLGVTDSYIYQVITDTDMFLFSDTYNSWLSYSGFKSALEESKLQLYAYVN